MAISGGIAQLEMFSRMVCFSLYLGSIASLKCDPGRVHERNSSSWVGWHAWQLLQKTKSAKTSSTAEEAATVKVAIEYTAKKVTGAAAVKQTKRRVGRWEPKLRVQFCATRKQRRLS